MNGYNKTVREQVFSKTNYRCAYCGNKLELKMDGVNWQYAFDHIVPRVKGGSDEPSNLFACCKSCNCKKKSKDLEFFRFTETLKLHNIPLFNKEQYDYLKSKTDLSILFPEPIKFYFEQL